MTSEKLLHEKKISELFEPGDDLHLYNKTFIDKRFKQWAIAVVNEIMKDLPKKWLKDKKGEKWGFGCSESDMYLVHFLIDRLEITMRELK